MTFLQLLVSIVCLNYLIYAEQLDSCDAGGLSVVNMPSKYSYAEQYNRNCFNSQSKIAHLSDRARIIHLEQLTAIGGQLELNARERQVDAFIKNRKAIDFANEVDSPGIAALGTHFFVAKPIIERSLIFKILQQMPKGAVLHAHPTSMIASEWIVKTITYRPDMMQCRSAKGYTIFTFRKADWHSCDSESYVLINDERQRAMDVETFDKDLEKHINLFTEQPDVKQVDVKVVWDRFANMFATVHDIYAYTETWDLLRQRIMQELYDDNVMYLEVRDALAVMYDTNGTISTQQDVVAAWRSSIAKFKETRPDFLGIKIIYSLNRRDSPETITTTMESYAKLYMDNRDIIIGADIDNNEDIGKPITAFVDTLLLHAPHTKYFFHAGETNMNGYSSDRNLIDAVLLNTTRIGHGFALIKHPVALDIVRQRSICLEISPISNQVLRLVSDLRNHPASAFVADNIPMVISNDNPGFWNAMGMSYDFYYALMSMASMEAGVGLLKQLVLNSLRFAEFTGAERAMAVTIFEKQWSQFLDKVIAEL